MAGEPSNCKHNPTTRYSHTEEDIGDVWHREKYQGVPELENPATKQLPIPRYSHTEGEVRDVRYPLGGRAYLEDHPRPSGLRLFAATPTREHQ